MRIIYCCIRLLVICLIISDISPAQGLGFTLGVNPPGVICFSFLANVRVTSDFRIEGKAGYVLGAEYGGVDAAANVYYYFLNPVYIIAGITNHSNEGFSSNSSGSRMANFLLGGAGLGVDIHKNISFEVMYSTPFNKTKWQSARDWSKNEVHWSYLKHVVRAEFKIHWDLW